MARPALRHRLTAVGWVHFPIVNNHRPFGIARTSLRSRPVAPFPYRARHCDPGVGRFASEDPLGVGAGDVNLNQYVGNGPTNGVDPSGMWNPFKVKQDPTRKRRPGLVTGAEILNDMHRRNAAMRPIIEQRHAAVMRGKAIGQAGQRMMADGAGLGAVVDAAEAIGEKDVLKARCNQLTVKERAVRGGWAASTIVVPAVSIMLERWGAKLLGWLGRAERRGLTHATEEVAQLAEKGAQVSRVVDRIDEAEQLCQHAPRNAAKTFEEGLSVQRGVGRYFLHRLVSTYAAWSTTIKTHAPSDDQIERRLETVFDRLEAANLLQGWLPQDSNDAIIESSFAEGWPMD